MNKVLLGIGFVVLTPVLIGGCIAFNWMGEAAAVAREEFGPREILRKYEWFKDASASLDAKNATITRIRTQISGLEADYEGEARKDWAREDRSATRVWNADLTGAIGSFNMLAAEYNAQMAKFNYRFANAGMLPEGATKPLPREYKPYTTL